VGVGAGGDEGGVEGPVGDKQRCGEVFSKSSLQAIGQGYAAFAAAFGDAGGDGEGLNGAVLKVGFIEFETADLSDTQAGVQHEEKGDSVPCRSPLGRERDSGRGTVGG